jgi:Leucine-rich repeat (LRR) protein
VVNRCGGLPLALEVIGAWVAEETRELSGADVDCWWKEELMEKLPELGNTESPQRGPSVLEILRSSYDGLPPALKDCFVLLTVWPTNAVGQYVGGELLGKLGALIPGALSIAQKGKRVLKDLKCRSLIKVDMKSGKEFVTIHDLLMELGRSIANEGRVYSASGYQNGYGQWYYRCSWSPPVPTAVQHLSLHYSDFTRVPASVIAQSQLKSIVLSNVSRIPPLLDLRGCQVVMFNECTGDFFNSSWQRLRCFILGQASCFRKLATLYYPPDLRKLSILQYLSLSMCKQLVRPPNISGLAALRHLDLNGCVALTSSPNVRGMNALQRLDLSGCVALTSPPTVQGLNALQHLDLSRCKALETPPDVQGLNALQHLDLSRCKALETPPDVQGLNALQHLDLSRWKALTTPPDVRGLPALQHLNLRECVALTTPPDVRGLSALQRLDLRWCEAITTPPDVRGLGTLQRLDMCMCKAMMTTPNVEGLANLQHLDLSSCGALTTPPNVGGLANLQHLDLRWCGNLTTPPDIRGLTGLHYRRP